jgi:zinc and cadmium transporter
MKILLFTILALAFAGLGSVLISSLLLLLRNRLLSQISTCLLYLSGGTLLASALLGLIPEAAETLPVFTVGIWILAGIIFFFLLEKVLLWRSCRDNSCQRKSHSAAPMIIIGDAFHNAIDGVVIAASFLTSADLGLFVTLSVLLHEIPQELGDFGILVKCGYSKRKALGYNLLSGATALIAGIAAYFSLNLVQSIVPYAIAVASAGFLYISLADLIPEMHKETGIRQSILQLIFVLAGIGIIILLPGSH